MGKLKSIIFKSKKSIIVTAVLLLTLVVGGGTAYWWYQNAQSPGSVGAYGLERPIG